MTALLVILLLSALAFGVGALLEGILWALLTAIVLLVAAVWFGWRELRERTGRHDRHTSSEDVGVTG